MIIIEYKKYGAQAPYLLEKARLRIINAEKVDVADDLLVCIDCSLSCRTSRSVNIILLDILSSVKTFCLVCNNIFVGSLWTKSFAEI